MIDGFVKAAAAVPKIRIADTVKNADAIISLLNEASAAGVKLVVFPELCVTGCTCGDLFFSDTLISGAEAAVRRIADATAELDMLAAVGVPARVGGKLYNCAAVISGGRILGLAAKTALSDFGGVRENRWFEPAPEFVGTAVICGEEVPFGRDILFECPDIYGLAVGVEIGSDREVPITPSASLVGLGASVILNPCAQPMTAGDAALVSSSVSALSVRLISGYVAAFAGDGESTTDCVYGGGGIVAEKGVVLAGRKFADGLTVSEIDVRRLMSERIKCPYFHTEICDVSVKFRLRSEETGLTRKYFKNPFIPDSVDKAEILEEILTVQSLGLKTRMENTGTRRLVIGLSGGLDSTLALLVCAKASDMLDLPRGNILAVTMPGFGTTGRTRTNAERLAESIGAELRCIPIGDSVAQHFKDIGHDESVTDVVYENAQARERTQVLMDVANGIGALVVGTGDLSELALGWATYNGDHMSMYAVNASVTKTLVRELTAYAADICEDEKLSETLRSILDTPVSPELLPAKDGEISQVTEDLVGPYELHDFFIYWLVGMGFSPRKVYRIAKNAFDGCYSETVILKWLRTFCRRFFAQQFKRSCMPDGPVTGILSLSPRGGWSMPSDASYALWLKELDDIG